MILPRTPGSLAFRLFLSAVVVTALVLLVVGVVLSSLYRAGTERAFDRRLEVYMKTIVGGIANSAVPSASSLPDPQALTDPLFIFPFSGWYWQMARLDTPEPEVRRSRSLPEGKLPTLESLGVEERPGGVREGYAPGPEKQVLRLVERSLDLGQDGRYLITVAGDASEIEEEITNFNLALVGTFGVLGLAFLLIVVFQVRFGLKPLGRIQEALSAVRSGKAERLEGEYPEEIAPLVREVNGLIDANKEIVERARTHVGNLAHALKTPLSVLVNEAGNRDDPLAVRVRDQAAVMRNQVGHHLERARMAARVSLVATVCEVTPIVTGLARTMEKIHRTKDLAIDVLGAEQDVRFRGERNDLEEMIGNLIDNACKWAGSRVEVSIITDVRSGRERNFFRIIIDDDGPGLSPGKRAEVRRRGRRLDESKPGSGLGLSIVHELTALYGGRFEMNTAPLGGLRTELVLPAV
ncbi:ATPase [Azorhizobium oxalatiphilum]|uniref:histidine kinase n=1 Tax=Azorhizobium oxalatiphilum TaxID=980631 RepID=A0A917BNS4_9HYPH|nr:ATP-binding protein [Azorhizobium oxalatiphilum]GGF53298.1 ATPase [Azorhizobium oxalatiphilum]